MRDCVKQRREKSENQPRPFSVKVSLHPRPEESLPNDTNFARAYSPSLHRCLNLKGYRSNLKGFARAVGEVDL